MKSRNNFLQRRIHNIGQKDNAQFGDQIDNQKYAAIVHKVYNDIGDEGVHDEEEPFCRVQGACLVDLDQACVGQDQEGYGDAEVKGLGTLKAGTELTLCVICYMLLYRLGVFKFDYQIAHSKIIQTPTTLILQYLKPRSHKPNRMDQLLQLLQTTSVTFDKVVIDLVTVQKKQEQDYYMQIEQQSNYEKLYTDTLINTYFGTASQYCFFDGLPDTLYNENFDAKISNVKMNSVSVRRKDQLFKRQKRQQEEKIILRRKELESKYPFNGAQLKFQGEFWIKNKQRNQIFAFKQQDFEKLRPQTDLNDTIMDNYLKLMQIAFLPQPISNKTFIFSTFFMGKLLGDYLRDDLISERDSEGTVEKVKRKVIEVYPIMKRWTKKIDLFEKEYVVIPINAYKHWNCLIVVSPGALLNETGQCKIIYLDSMFEKKPIFSQAIKTFLELQLADRKSIATSLDNQIQTYQLLVPRQTNTHDCGLYTLCYIECLLKNHEILDENLQVVRNREQLRLFPRSLVFTMREGLRQLFRNLLTMERKEQAIKEFNNFRWDIERNSNEADYDEISQRQFKKYYRLNSHLLDDKKKKESEVEYQCKVKFYLDCQVNHYEKDTNPP